MPKGCNRRHYEQEHKGKCDELIGKRRKNKQPIESFKSTQYNFLKKQSIYNGWIVLA
jgi:hypothetical protein